MLWINLQKFLYLQAGMSADKNEKFEKELKGGGFYGISALIY